MEQDLHLLRRFSYGLQGQAPGRKVVPHQAQGHGEAPVGQAREPLRELDQLFQPGRIGLQSLSVYKLILSGIIIDKTLISYYNLSLGIQTTKAWQDRFGRHLS